MNICQNMGVSLSLQLLVFPFIVIVIPLATSLTFSYDHFGSNEPNITYEGDAYAAGGAIQLTTNMLNGNMYYSLGRATYSKPLHLWDKASGNVTDFSTHFSFIIDSQNKTPYADGLAFFLSPERSVLDAGYNDRGGELGLTSSKSFVAVEFDTFQNWYDPQGDHVGIDINSIKSAVSVSWLSSIPYGNKTDVSISYSSTSKNLSVVFSGFKYDSTSIVLQHLSYKLDLKEYLPEWVTVGFTGATGDYYQIQSIYSWNFTSSLEINDNITNPGVPLPSPKPQNAPTKNRIGLVIGSVVGGCSLVVVCVLVLLAFCRKRKVRKDDILDGSMSDEFERSRGPKKFLYSELVRCTNNFAPEEKLGEGGFGGVYKGYLRELNSYVAVKRVSSESKQGIKEYKSEVQIISRLRHKHLVKLIGWCHEKRELLLVYEFMLNGSLDSHLFKGKSHLTWPIRYKIAQGLASALRYLHEEMDQCVVHRDIKSSNIMLDSSFNAKLGDFGLARLIDHEKGSQTTVMAGTKGYMAPEYQVTSKASKETDVYSFGVVALEIACGRRPTKREAEYYQANIVKWVWRLYGIGNLHEAVDPTLSTDFNEKEMENLLILGLWCAHPESNCRPSIGQAIHVLNFEAPLPTLPLIMPVPTYCTPPEHLPCDTNGPEIALAQVKSLVNRNNNPSSNNATASASLLYTC